MAITKEQVQSAVDEMIDVNTEKSLAVTKSVKGIEVDGGKVSINIVLGYPAAGYFTEIQQQVADAPPLAARKATPAKPGSPRRIFTAGIRPALQRRAPSLMPQD